MPNLPFTLNILNFVAIMLFLIQFNYNLDQDVSQMNKINSALHLAQELASFSHFIFQFPHYFFIISFTSNSSKNNVIVVKMVVAWYNFTFAPVC